MKKKQIKIGVSLIILFIVYNLIWLSNAYFIYSPFTKKVPKHESGIYAYHDAQTGYTYNVKFPNYLSFTGNLGVSDNNGSGMIVWPGFFGGKYEYGVRIKAEDAVYTIYIDADMDPVGSDGDIKNIYDSNKDKIEALWNALHEMWGDELKK